MHPEIGTVSWGTMRIVDLVPRLLKVLEEFDPGTYRRIAKDDAKLIALILTAQHDWDLHREPTRTERVRDWAIHAVQPVGWLLWRTVRWNPLGKLPRFCFRDPLEDASYFLNEDIWDAMNDIAPEGCYFGATEGDGCDYGFWESRPEYGDEEEEGETPSGWESTA